MAMPVTKLIPFESTYHNFCDLCNQPDTKEMRYTFYLGAAASYKMLLTIQDPEQFSSSLSLIVDDFTNTGTSPHKVAKLDSYYYNYLTKRRYAHTDSLRFAFYAGALSLYFMMQSSDAQAMCSMMDIEAELLKS